MQVTVAKVHENLFSGDAISVTVPTSAGEVTILGKHEPLVAPLKSGTIIVRTASGEHTFAVESGVLEVSADQTTVLL
jgi:F-type H+-transporting ATPase subunit epsilon